VVPHETKRFEGNTLVIISQNFLSSYCKGNIEKTTSHSASYEAPQEQEMRLSRKSSSVFKDIIEILAFSFTVNLDESSVPSSLTTESIDHHVDNSRLDLVLKMRFLIHNLESPSEKKSL
jgi:hypothetical protein